MPTFELTPDLRILNRYLTKTTDEDFDRENPNYQLHSIELELLWGVFLDESSFDKSFKELLAGYQLLNHYDNLLYLTLYTYDEVWEGIQLAYDEYQPKQRARELAQVLLILIRNKFRRHLYSTSIVHGVIHSIETFSLSEKCTWLILLHLKMKRNLEISNDMT